MADLVAAGLSDHRAVTLYLTLRARAGETGRRHHIVNSLLAAPALGMETCIYHEACRPEQERLEVARLLDAFIGAPSPTATCSA